MFAVIERDVQTLTGPSNLKTLHFGRGALQIMEVRCLSTNLSSGALDRGP